MNTPNWQPASIEAIRLRAALYAKIRTFFKQRDVMEVDTPITSKAANTDPNIESLVIAEPRLYLQTSPEFAMKRLLAKGSGPIYQIAKAFRRGEYGKKHRPEFTMLEWYRPGMSYHQLMDEIAELWQLLVADAEVEKISYRDLFQWQLQLDPHRADAAELALLARKHTGYQGDEDDRDTLLDLLMSHVVEPGMDKAKLTFVYDYPASQCALAKVAPDGCGEIVAQRFELYAGGIELANGYQELTDWQEQARRFQTENNKRKMLGLNELPVDEELIEALRRGLPECSGVALGIDRLMMLILDVDDIAEVD